MNKYKVIDNFLNKQDFLKIKEIVESDDFPYFLQKDIVHINENNNELNCYFTHNIFNQVNGFSSYYKLFLPLFEKINYKALIRVKGNLYPRTEKLEQHEPHVDYDYEHKGAIFSINTNDGGTILNGNEKVDSIENRILFFDPSKEHSSTTTTNAKYRMNININYF